MRKTFIVKELKDAIAMYVSISTFNGCKTKEIARFCNSGMGWIALGSAGRYMLKCTDFDAIKYDGSKETYDRLVSVGVIEQLEVA